MGAILFDESKGVAAGVKSVGADKNIRKVKIECKAVFIHYTGGII